MPNTANLAKFIPGKGFDELVRKFNAELLELEALLAKKTTETVLRLGKYIEAHILENKGRADYGEYLIPYFALKVGKDPSTIRRMLKFCRLYSIRGLAHELTWGHYQRLIGVEDDKERKQIEDKIIKEGWNTRKLRQYLSKRRKFAEAKNDGKPIAQLQFTRGRPFVYRVIEVVDAQSQQTTRRLDLGFKVGRPFQDDFKKGDFVEARGVNQECSLKEANASLDEIFTYKASVLKVVDGDTLTVDMDTGLNEFIGKKLRLRGIDCPEMDTEEGKRAKRFVESRLKDCEFIIVKTHKDQSDMWDRYLADVFYLKDESEPSKVAGQGVFLNQELLDRGLARLWE